MSELTLKVSPSDILALSGNASEVFKQESLPPSIAIKQGGISPIDIEEQVPYQISLDSEEVREKKESTNVTKKGAQNELLECLLCCGICLECCICFELCFDCC